MLKKTKVVIAGLGTLVAAAAITLPLVLVSKSERGPQVIDFSSQDKVEKFILDNSAQLIASMHEDDADKQEYKIVTKDGEVTGSLTDASVLSALYQSVKELPADAKTPESHSLLSELIKALSAKKRINLGNLENDGVLWSHGISTMAVGQTFSFLETIARNLGFNSDDVLPHDFKGVAGVNIDSSEEYTSAEKAANTVSVIGGNLEVSLVDSTHEALVGISDKSDFTYIDFASMSDEEVAKQEKIFLDRIKAAPSTKSVLAIFNQLVPGMDVDGLIQHTGIFKQFMGLFKSQLHLTDILLNNIMSQLMRVSQPDLIDTLALPTDGYMSQLPVNGLDGQGLVMYILPFVSDVANGVDAGWGQQSSSLLPFLYSFAPGGNINVVLSSKKVSFTKPDANNIAHMYIPAPQKMIDAGKKEAADANKILNYVKQINTKRELNQVLSASLNLNSLNMYYGNATIQQDIVPIGNFNSFKPTDFRAWGIHSERTNVENQFNLNTDGAGNEYLDINIDAPRFNFTAPHQSSYQIFARPQYIKYINTSYFMINDKGEGEFDHDPMSSYYFKPINYRTRIDANYENRVILEIEYLGEISGSPQLVHRTYTLDKTLIKGYNDDFTVKNKYPTLVGDEKEKALKDVKDVFEKLKSVFGDSKALIDLASHYGKGVKGVAKIKSDNPEKNISDSFFKLLEWMSVNLDKFTDEVLETNFEKFNKLGSIYWKAIQTILYGYEGGTRIADIDSKEAEIQKEIQPDANVHSVYARPELILGNKDPKSGIGFMANGTPDRYTENVTKSGILDFSSIIDIISWAQDGEMEFRKDVYTGDNMRTYRNVAWSNVNWKLSSAWPLDSGFGNNRFVIKNEVDLANFKKNYPHFAADKSTMLKYVVFQWEDTKPLDLTQYDTSVAAFYNMDMSNVKYTQKPRAFALTIFDHTTNMNEFVRGAIANTADPSKPFSKMFDDAVFNEINEAVDFSGGTFFGAKFLNIDDMSKFTFDHKAGVLTQVLLWNVDHFSLDAISDPDGDGTPFADNFVIAYNANVGKENWGYSGSPKKITADLPEWKA